MPQRGQSKMSKIPANRDEIRNEEIPDIWSVLKIRGKLGYRQDEITTHQTESWNLSKKEHYFVVDDNAKRSIKCISCSIPHGGILEARKLDRYRLDDGILYLDDKPVNKRARLTVDED